MQNLLILHGAIGAKDQFIPLSEKLQDRFRIHTMNFSGHGGLVIDGEFSIQRFAKDVLNFLNQNEIETTDVFGYSLGGYVALHLAKTHPDRIGKIFTLATKFEWTPDIAWRETKMLDAAKIEEKIPAFAKQLELRHAPSDWKAVLQKTSDMMIGLGDENPLQFDDYATIPNEILIGIGDKDVMVTLEETIAVYRKLQNAKFLVMPNTQHPIEKVDLERLASEIDLFFKG